MWSTTRKSRKVKTVKIEPLKVLHRRFERSWDYESYEITELRYKVKTKPEVHDSTGERHFIYRGSGVYYDTPKNRELLSLIQKLESQRSILQSKISEFHKDIERVDVSKLHERSLQTSEKTQEAES